MPWYKSARAPPCPAVATVTTATWVGAECLPHPQFHRPVPWGSRGPRKTQSGPIRSPIPSWRFSTTKMRSSTCNSTGADAAMRVCTDQSALTHRGVHSTTATRTHSTWRTLNGRTISSNTFPRLAQLQSARDSRRNRLQRCNWNGYVLGTTVPVPFLGLTRSNYWAQPPVRPTFPADLADTPTHADTPSWAVRGPQKGTLVHGQVSTDTCYTDTDVLRHC